MKIPSVSLHSLNPFGPILGKELRTTARHKRHHLLRVGYLAGLSLFLLLAFVATRSNYGYSSVAARIQQQNQLGQNFFATFSLFAIGSMGLIAPILTCTAIGGERLAKTLPVLLMTPITSWQIVVGKLLSRLLIALMLLGLSLPVLALVRLLGGVEIEQMVSVLCLCTVFALSCAALGLFFSTLVNRAYAVILLAYAALLLLYVFVPFLAAAGVASSRTSGWMGFYTFLQATNPVVATFMQASPELPRVWRPQWAPCVGVQLLLTALLLLGSALILRRHARREGETAIAPAQVPASTDSLEPAPADAGLTSRHTRSVSDNPVLWRETRRPLMSRRWSWVAGVSVTALLLLSYAASAAIPGNPLGDEEYHIAYAFVFNALWWLLIAVLSGTAIAQEKESDTWTLLLVTPVSGRAIVFGKLLGLCRRMFWPLVLVVFHFCIFGLANVVSWQSALLVVWVMLTFNALWAALGVALSLVTRKVTTAVIVNLIVPVVLYAGVPLVLLVLGELLANNDNWAEITLWYLPYYYMGEGLNRLGKNFSWDRNAYLPGIGSQGTTGQFVQAAVAIGIAHVALAWVILQGTAARFDTIVGRARQRWVNAP